MFAFDRARSRSPRPVTRCRPALEALEDRCTPSLFGNPPGYRLSSTDNLLRHEQANASSVNGMTVVVWTYRNNAEQSDIRAQLFGPDRLRLGGEIVVAQTAGDERSPAVAMDNQGDFVVVWQRTDSTGDRDLYAARYDNTGALRGTLTVAATARDETDPGVAMDGFGNFVISYTWAFTATNTDVHARRYSEAGTYLSLVYVANSANPEAESAVARNTFFAASDDANAAFAVAYRIALPSTTDVTLRRYTGAGALLGAHAVAATTEAEGRPAVAMDNAANVAVAWETKRPFEGHNVRARKVFNNGALGVVTTIESGGLDGHGVSVAMDRSDGDYVVAYHTVAALDEMPIGFPSGHLQEVSSNGTLRGAAYSLGEFRTDFQAARDLVLGLSITGDDYYLVTYHSFIQPPPDQTHPPGIYGRWGRLY